MKDIEERYQETSGLKDRSLYKIYYSHIHPFPILILGFNPGGMSNSTYLASSETFYENWEHDYVRFQCDRRYRVASPMMYLLSVTLDTKSANTLRQIPATNIIFRRSQSSDNLNLSISRAFTEARPYLQELIQIVTPKVILFISKTAYNQFKKKLCADVREDHEYEVKTPNGKNHVTLFISATGYLPCLSRNIRLLTVCHPSKYASRTEWSQALKILQDEFRTLGLSPLDPHPAIQKLRVLADHLDMP